MNAIVNKFLLGRYNFMFETHLRQPRFRYSACGPFTKSKKRFKKLKEIWDILIKTNYIKLVFNMKTSGDFKDLDRSTAVDKVLRDNALVWTCFNGLYFFW